MPVVAERIGDPAVLLRNYAKRKRQQNANTDFSAQISAPPAFLVDQIEMPRSLSANVGGCDGASFSDRFTLSRHVITALPGLRQRAPPDGNSRLLFAVTTTGGRGKLPLGSFPGQSKVWSIETSFSLLLRACGKFPRFKKCRTQAIHGRNCVWVQIGSTFALRSGRRYAKRLKFLSWKGGRVV